MAVAAIPVDFTLAKMASAGVDLPQRAASIPMHAMSEKHLNLIMVLLENGFLWLLFI
jgi:hypothetical protein